MVGTRFGCLHPLTSLRLYSTFCVPVMLYGCELWVPSKSEFLMLEWVHRKILRTIQGLPIRCSSLALQILVGLPSVSSIIFQHQLAFLHSLSAMSSNSLPLQLMLLRLSSLPRKGLIFHLQHILAELSLPSLSDIPRGSWSRSVWKCQVKSITQTLWAANFHNFWTPAIIFPSLVVCCPWESRPLIGLSLVATLNFPG